MDIALSSLTIFLIILPGILYNRFFYDERQHLSDSERSWGALLVSSLLPGLVIQGFGVFIISQFPLLQLRLDILGFLLSGCNDDKNTASIFNAIQNSYGKIILYFICINILSIGIARAFRHFVLKNFIDTRFPQLFKYGKWYYYLAGRKEKGSDFTKIDVLVNTETGTSLYSGFLVDFTLSDNSIETLYLRNTIRWVETKETDENGKTKKKHYVIPGKYFIIPGKEILNFNLTYLRIERVRKEKGNNKKSPGEESKP
jgi:hypothetical protein